jgi:hypothetical protein
MLISAVAPYRDASRFQTSVICKIETIVPMCRIILFDSESRGLNRTVSPRTTPHPQPGDENQRKHDNRQ